jgi:hypothetical protein
MGRKGGKRCPQAGFQTRPYEAVPSYFAKIRRFENLPKLYHSIRFFESILAEIRANSVAALR